MADKYTIREVAELLGVSHDTVTRWVKSGKVEGVRRGPFPGKTTPILISASEVKRVQKLIEAPAGSAATKR
jgi:excisionase family DNA binding protein